MDRDLFFLVFIPGLTIGAVAISFALSAFAMTQGPFLPDTRRGLLSLVGVVLVGTALFVLAFQLDHPTLPGAHHG
jgi:hypothetical protein